MPLLHKLLRPHHINEYNLCGKILLLKFPLQKKAQTASLFRQKLFATLYMVIRSVNFLRAVDIEVIKIINDVD